MSALLVVDHPAIINDLYDALREIERGCINRRPGHIDFDKNRTKAEIEAIATAAIEKAGRAMGWTI